jgi:hypothetical protein
MRPMPRGLPATRTIYATALRVRLRGPGGYYNIGNALGLAGGLALHVAAVRALDFSSGSAAAAEYLVGSPSAIAITAAMLIFFWSGESYHRAWAGGFPPDARRNRQGDILSGYGALALGLGLLLIGEALLAATAGLLHALGKFGSALHHRLATRWMVLRPDPFRTAVLLSRLPAIALVIIEIARAGTAADQLAPSLLLVCYLLWAKADLLLFRS